MSFVNLEMAMVVGILALLCVGLFFISARHKKNHTLPKQNKNRSLYSFYSADESEDDKKPPQ